MWFAQIYVFKSCNNSKSFEDFKNNKNYLYKKDKNKPYDSVLFRSKELEKLLFIFWHNNNKESGYYFKNLMFGRHNIPKI